MDRQSHSRWRTAEIPLSLLMLVILLWFTVGIFIRVPYTGFYFDPNSGVVLDVYDRNNASLQPGDVLVKVGNIPFKDFVEDSAQPLFANGLERAVVPIQVERAGNEIVVDWEMPGFNLIEFRGRLFNIYWLAYVFWFFGALIEMFIRPRDVRWWLLIAVNHLTGFWLMTGAISSWQILGGSLLFHALTWLLLPVYLHLHWIFPQPLMRLPKNFGIIFYSIAVLLSIVELLQLPPKNLFFLPFILALSGSLILLVSHFIFRPQHRSQIGLLATSTLLAILPAIFMSVVGLSGELPISAPLALIAFVFMPIMYLYLIFRSRLGGLEARANRFISLFAYLILAGTFLIIIAHAELTLPVEESAFINIALPLLIAGVSIGRFPAFEAFINQRFLGIKLPYQHLPETYSSRITTSTSLPSLLALLEDEVFPSLLIRQYAFLQVSDKSLNTLLAKNIPDDSFDFDSLSQKAGSTIPNPSSAQDWTRLILPLKVGNATLGFWLLGKRDPDDLYPLVEIPILQSLADQTAIALSNILQTEQLRNYYQNNTERIEDERKRVSRDLHDIVLNELATLRNSLDPTPPPAFESSYEGLKARLREIIANLHPPMLDHGLPLALTDMVEDLRDKYQSVEIILKLQPGEERLPEKVEEHLYQILHEACENALRHAHPKTLTISGILTSQRVDLSIQDDGQGFDSSTDPNALIARKHFGLTNMKERAHIIGAELTIQSHKARGTTIRILIAAPITVK